MMDEPGKGFRLWMNSMAAEKAELLSVPVPHRGNLKTLRQWRRGLIEAYRAEFRGYPAIEAEVLKIARHGGAALYEGADLSTRD